MTLNTLVLWTRYDYSGGAIVQGLNLYDRIYFSWALMPAHSSLRYIISGGS